MRCVPYGIRNEIQAETQLAVSVGVAASKFVTEAASEESEPDGLMIVELRTEIAFWGVIASIDCRKVVTRAARAAWPAGRVRWGGRVVVSGLSFVISILKP